ncbi:hypothetical protein E3N88_25788 [Mikania micrantha]|uniref:Uncharacterized protein n=1 Tax=Mikania micrantha TaxID=192012 RepID=A0A5N6N5R4_9ASTR|nr:hypothetical protein E3N88_25788 [Mikania micrantha]
MILKEVSAAGNRDCAGGSLQLDQGGNVVCRPQRSLTRGVTAVTRLRMRSMAPGSCDFTSTATIAKTNPSYLSRDFETASLWIV